jgi:hypothetical protein
MSLTTQEKNEIKRIIQTEFKSFLNSTNAHNIVVNHVKKEMKTNNINDKVIELSTKVVVELFKTLWQRKGFWENAIKKVK